MADFGDFKVKHIAGKKNIPADALSRVPWKETMFSEMEKQEVIAPMWQPEKPVDWVKEQKADDDLKQLKQWLTSGSKPPQREVSALSPCLRSYWFAFDQFALLDGIVTRTWTETDGSPDRQLRVVPLKMRNKVLEGHHDQLVHPGVSKMLIMLRKKYHWYKMSEDVNRYVQTCNLCQITKARVAKAPLVQHPLSYMSQNVFCDVKGPTTRSARDNDIISL